MSHVIETRVAEATTTTGTGDITLAGALVGHRAFSSVCTTADTTEYVIYAVDASGTPLGDWEEGKGTYSAANTLTRTTVTRSSNSNNLVSFAVGTKIVILTPLGSRVGLAPLGGTTGQALVKASSGDFDMAWGGLSNTRWIGAGELIPRVTNGAGIDGEELATNKINLDYLAFDAGTAEYAQASFDWPSGFTTLTAKLFWTAASGSGSVVWGAQARCYADDDALDQAQGTAQTVTDTLLAASDAHITSATSSITPGGTVSAGNLTVVQVYRDATSGSDTLAVDARLIGVLLTFA